MINNIIVFAKTCVDRLLTLGGIVITELYQ